MPAAPKRFTLPVKQFRKTLSKTVSEEANLEPAPIQAGPSLERNLNQSNILNLQRTIGNQAVLRMLQERQTAKQAPSQSVSDGVIQRKIADKESYLKKLRSVKGLLSNSTLSQIISTNRSYQKAAAEDEFPYLAKLRFLCKKWLASKRTNAHKEFNIQVFQLHVENEIKTKLSSLASRTGLPPSYLEELLEHHDNPLMYLAQADAFLENGEVGKADNALTRLKETLPDKSYGLLRSSLVRLHLGTINPNIAKAVNDPKYSQDDAEKAKRGEDVFASSMKNTHTGPLASYTRTVSGSEKAINPKDDPDVVAHKEETRKRIKKELVMTDLKALENMSSLEKDSITAYTAKNYEEINPNLRNMSLTGKKDAEKHDPSMAAWGVKGFYRDKFTEDKQIYTQNAISGLNKLPPLKGKKVYRHDKVFPGFEQVYREGATVSDMAFTSTTYEPTSLQSGFGEDILSIITSQTGRFIKPISINAPEDEVLFKPGARFIIKKVYAAQLREGDEDYRGWPKDLPAAVKSVLSKDPSGKKIKYVVVREEVV